MMVNVKSEAIFVLLIIRNFHCTTQVLSKQVQTQAVHCQVVATFLNVVSMATFLHWLSGNDASNQPAMIGLPWLRAELS